MHTFWKQATPFCCLLAQITGPDYTHNSKFFGQFSATLTLASERLVTRSQRDRMPSSRRPSPIVIHVTVQPVSIPYAGHSQSALLPKTPPIGCSQTLETKSPRTDDRFCWWPASGRCTWSAARLYHTYMVSNIANTSHGTGCGKTRRVAQWNSVRLPGIVRIK